MLHIQSLFTNPSSDECANHPLRGKYKLEDFHLENECNKEISLDLQSFSWEVIGSNQTVIGVYFCSISSQSMQARSYKWT